MIDGQFWAEEMRSFPCGGGGARLWVVRREGAESDAPLRMLVAWACGQEAQQEATAAPPLGLLLRVVNEGRPEEICFGTNDNRRRETKEQGTQAEQRTQAEHREGQGDRPRTELAGRRLLWSEPLGDGQQNKGAFAMLYDTTDPWGVLVRIWGQCFAARIGSLLPELVAWSGRGPSPQTDMTGNLPTLFSVAPFQRSAVRRCGPVGPTAGLALPRPAFIAGLNGAVGICDEMRQLGAQLESVATSGVNVMLQGESGTGKEIFAQAIHAASRRRIGPMVGQNCAALPESLFESELFGHKAGAFTGAGKDKPGLLEAADGGTFFLDEIGDMPLPLQIKLLRVIQDRRVRRIGELDSRLVDIRFIAATHKDLEKEIAAGRFRLDLYFRLKVVCLTIPPLRRRPEDIAHLLAFFLARNGRDIRSMSVSDGALAALQAWRWPGNVRELENEVQRLLALYPEVRLVRRDMLSEEIQHADCATVDPADLGTLRPLEQASELLERYLIRKAIAASAGRKAAAARRLGLSRQGLYKKIQRFGMTDLIGCAAG